MNELTGARRDFSRIGLGMFVMVVLSVGLMQLAARILIHYFGEQVVNIPWVMLAVASVVQYFIAMPAAYLIIRGMKKDDVRPFSISFGKICILFLICYFLMYAGNLLGLGTTALIQHFTDSTMLPLVDDVFSGVNLLVYSVSAVIFAPIIEELFFRKLLITRLERYGEGPAILVSGLLFGIIHGNLNQAFYAVLLGIVFGYIYIRTRKIIVTIGLHMVINLLGGVAFPMLVNTGSLLLVSLVGLTALGFAIAGLVLFILRVKKVKLLPRENQLPQPGWGQYAFTSVGMILFFVAGTTEIVLYTINSLIPN